jgi:phosphoesterase RecJ-like protein
MKNKIGEFLRSRPAFRILSHVDPDGDSVGSSLALFWVLRDLGKRVRVHFPGDVPEFYRFLAGAERAMDRVPERPGAEEAIIVLDSTSPERLGPLADLLAPGTPVVNVDHHPDNAGFGDLAWVDPTAAATALLVFELCRDARLPLGSDAAEGLYVGILTDTGRFTFRNTDSRALAAAAELTGLGARAGFLASRVYEERSPGATKLLGLALATLELHQGGRVACLHVTQEMIAAAGALPEDAEGFATYARSIRGVVVGIFLREAEDGLIKISFRSNGGIPIDGLAGQFGGGGHPAASGARVSGPLAKAKESVLRAIAELLATRGA